MPDVFETPFEQIANVEIRDRVVGDAAGSRDLDDPMHPQESKRMRYRRLTETDCCRQVTHTHWTAQQRNQDSDPVRLAQKGEDIGKINNICRRGHARPCYIYPSGVYRFRRSGTHTVRQLHRHTVLSA
jgi:hypothetical protein